MINGVDQEQKVEKEEDEEEVNGILKKKYKYKMRSGVGRLIGKS